MGNCATNEQTISQSELSGLASLYLRIAVREETSSPFIQPERIEFWDEKDFANAVDQYSSGCTILTLHLKVEL